MGKDLKSQNFKYSIDQTLQFQRDRVFKPKLSVRRIRILFSMLVSMESPRCISLMVSLGFPAFFLVYICNLILYYIKVANNTKKDCKAFGRLPKITEDFRRLLKIAEDFPMTAEGFSTTSKQDQRFPISSIIKEFRRCANDFSNVFKQLHSLLIVRCEKLVWMREITILDLLAWDSRIMQERWGKIFIDDFKTWPTISKGFSTNLEH